MADPFAGQSAQQPWFTDASSYSHPQQPYGAPFQPQPQPPLQASGFMPSAPFQPQAAQQQHAFQPFIAAQPQSAVFVPSFSVEGGRLSSLPNFDDEPALLVELGINFSSIAKKTMSALHPTGTLDPSLMADGDLAAPLVFCLIMGFFLMLTGKLHFGFVFGFAVSGSIALWVVLNLMTPLEEGIRLHVVVSVLGYALMPVVALSGVAVFVSLRGPLGYVLVPCAVGWCTLTATRFFETALSAREQRYLIAYPSFLLYACFALIAVF